MTVGVCLIKYLCNVVYSFWLIVYRMALRVTGSIFAGEDIATVCSSLGALERCRIDLEEVDLC